MTFHSGAQLCLGQILHALVVFGHIHALSDSRLLPATQMKIFAVTSYLHWHNLSRMFTLRSSIHPLAVSYLPIAGARQQCGQTCGVLRHAVHPISVSIQRAQERLGKNPVKLGGIQSPRILSAHLKGMERWIIVSRNWEYKQSFVL